MPALEDYYECLHHKKEVRLSTSPEANSHQSYLRGYDT